MKNVNKLKALGRALTPPFVWQIARRLLIGRQHDIEWEYIPQGWERTKSVPAIKGWDVEAVLKAYQGNWSNFVKTLQGSQPFGLSPESGSSQRTNILFHNIMMTYGYVLVWCTRNKTSFSMLDWGGGIGHYYLISQRLAPASEIDYHCKDFARFAEYGKVLFPEAHFYSDDTCLNRTYEFVLASTSLQYSENWRAVLKGLAGATAEYAFITRLPIVHHVPSYVFVQRPYQYGYNTEYPAWCFNRETFLQYSASVGLELLREFVVEQLPPIYRAPEQPEHWGFLFRKML